MCVVLVPNIGLRTTLSNSTKIRPQYFRNFMRVYWEYAWCQCQILILAPAYPTLHKYAHSTYKKPHVCPLGMCVVLVPNIGISTSIFNTTQIRPQQFRNFMCVHWECTWCQCKILVLEPPYPTLHKYSHSTSETSCVSTGNVRGFSAKYWSQNHHIQHFTNTPTALQKLNVLPLGMCVVLMPNIGLNTSIFNTTQIYPQHFRNFLCGNVRGASHKYQSQNHLIKQYKNTPTVLQKRYACLLGICVVLVPNIGISTNISNSTQIRPQYFRNVMSVYWECAWCQCQILVLAPTYPTVHKYAHSTSETSCVFTGNAHGASAKYWYQHQRIQHYTNTPTVLQKLHVCPLGMCAVLVPNIGLRTTISNTTQIRPQYFRNFMCVHCECVWCQCQILVLTLAYLTLYRYAHSTSETSCVSTENVRGASPNIGLRTTISNTTQIRPQLFRNFMCVHWECAWCYCQIQVLEPPYPTLHKYAHSSSET